MKYIIFIIFLTVSFTSKCQIAGNWFFSTNINLFNTDKLIAYKTNPNPKDTSALLNFDTINNVEYCPKYFIKSIGNAISINCSPNGYSDSKYLKYNDTLQIIFHNIYYPLTDSEIKKLNKKQLEEHYKNFGKSRILYFKIIIDTSERLILVKINVP